MAPELSEQSRDGHAYGVARRQSRTAAAGQPLRYLGVVLLPRFFRAVVAQVDVVAVKRDDGLAARLVFAVFRGFVNQSGHVRAPFVRALSRMYGVALSLQAARPDAGR